MPDCTDMNKQTSDSVELPELVRKSTEWNAENKNPDFNLVVVNGSNDDFVSKMRTNEVGSYLTYCFTKVVIERARTGEMKGLSDLLKRIQNELHSSGKQLIEFKCNNDTDKLRIEKHQT